MSGLARGFRGLIRPNTFDITSQSASIKVGTTYQISYTITPSDAKNKKVIWTSSDNNIATVSNNGLISAIDTGNITITGRTEDLSLTDTISVDTYVIHTTGVSLNKSSATLYQGDTVKLNATVTPADTSYPGVTWYSSNTSVATVSSAGLVTYVGEGNCVITVTTVDGGYTATCSIECIALAPVDRCFGYTGGQQTITLEPRKYCIEVWGAQGGGSYNNNPGAKGAYAAGTIEFTSQVTLYIYVGGQGGCSTTLGCHSGIAGGYNGGGTGGGTYYSSGCSSTGGGGGGTDIRYNGTTLCNRFIVAGAGAGGGTQKCGSCYYYSCGGGGASNGCGVWCGTQTAAGRCGGFGQGANATVNTNWRSTTPGGGGGWYGGGGCCVSDNTGASSALVCASGGSSYTYTSSTCGNHPNKACLGNLPLMTNAICCGCGSSFPTASGSTETGHTGNGCVRIRSI